MNCLNSLYLAHEDRFCVTPVGHVFAMYAAHQGGQSLRTEFTAPEIQYDRDGKNTSFWGLKGSASLHGKELVLTAVNPNVRAPLEAQIVVHGARIGSADATVLTASEIHAHNTFVDHQAVTPVSQKVHVSDGGGIFHFPAASVSKIVLQLS